MRATSLPAVYGIYAVTKGNANGAYSNVGIDIDNKGDITSGSNGIFAQTFGSATGFASNAGIHIDNEADIVAGDFGIRAQTFGDNAGVTIDNDGDITAALNEPTDPPSSADGIYAFTAGANSPIHIENEGDITVYGAFVPLPPPYSDQSAGVYDGMYAVSVGGHSGITVINSGHLTTHYGEAIDIRTYGGVADPPIPPDRARARQSQGWTDLQPGHRHQLSGTSIPATTPSRSAPPACATPIAGAAAATAPSS